MATWSPISNSVPQFSKNAGGAAAADYYLKFYLSGTTTPTSMATDSTGGTLLDKCKIDSLGYPVNGSDEVFIPHIDQAYKLALYTNATDADNNATGSAAWVVDGLTFKSFSQDASNVTYTPAGTGAVVTNAQDKFRESVSVKDFGAVGGDGVTDDTAAIQAALDSGAACILFPKGTYKQDSQLTLRANQTLYLHGATIKPSSSLSDAAWLGTSANNLSIYGGTFEGTGVAQVTGNEQLLRITSSDNVKIYDTKITKSRNTGLSLRSCTNSLVHGVTSSSNYNIGIEDRDGVGNKIVNCVTENNGETGVASGPFGRGILIWRCFDTTVLNCRIKGNNEYGLRIFSQTGDLTSSAYIKVIGCHAEDNGDIDYYIYNEIGSLAQIEFDACTVRRTIDPAQVPVSLQGERVNWRGGKIVKTGTALSTVAMNFFDLSNSRISGVEGSNLTTFTGWSSSSPCSNVTFENSSGDCAEFGGVNGTDISIKNNNFTHSGAGVTDTCIIAQTVTGLIVDGNEFDGYYRNISWTTQTITARNNSSQNTTDVSLYMSGAGDLIYEGNDWDVANNPASLDDSNGAITPTIIGTSTPGTASYSTRVGWYEKKGNVVEFQIHVNYSGGTGSGNLRISGLPFASASSTTKAFGTCSLGYVSNIALTAGNWLTAYIPSSSNEIALAQNATGGGASAFVPYDVAGEILISGRYFV